MCAPETTHLPRDVTADYVAHNAVWLRDKRGNKFARLAINRRVHWRRQKILCILCVRVWVCLHKCCLCTRLGTASWWRWRRRRRRILRHTYCYIELTYECKQIKSAQQQVGYTHQYGVYSTNKISVSILRIWRLLYIIIPFHSMRSAPIRTGLIRNTCAAYVKRSFFLATDICEVVRCARNSQTIRVTSVYYLRMTNMCRMVFFCGFFFWRPELIVFAFERCWCFRWHTFAQTLSSDEIATECRRKRLCARLEHKTRYESYSYKVWTKFAFSTRIDWYWFIHLYVF